MNLMKFFPTINTVLMWFSDNQGLDMPKVQLECVNQCNSTKIAQLARGDGLLHTESNPYKSI